MQYFDRVYVLNRKCDTKRLETITKQFRDFGIVFEVFEATDKNDLTADVIEELKKNNKYAYPGNKTMCDYSCSCRGQGHELSTGQLACALSHYRMYEDIVNKGYSRALIFEDDVVLRADFHSLMKEYVDQLKTKHEGWQLVYFGKNDRESSNNNPVVNKIYSGFSGTHMYAISQNAAQLLASNFYPIRAAADGYLAHFAIYRRMITEAYASNINLCYNASVSAAINSTI